MSKPTSNLELQGQLIRLFARAALMGAPPAALRLDGATLSGVLHRLQQNRLLSNAAVGLAPLLEKGPEQLAPSVADRMQAEVDRLLDVLEDSPAPQAEWASLRPLLSDALLARMLSVSEVSVRRYAGAERDTPLEVAARLHWVAMVVADLMGAYNEFGIRRWFDRPRAQLGNKSPLQKLGADWDPDDEAALQVRSLAAALVSAQALTT